MKQEPIKVNRNIIDIMNMNREQRRRIARQNGLKNIPSIVNVQVINAPAESVKKVVDSEVPNEPQV